MRITFKERIESWSVFMIVGPYVDVFIDSHTPTSCQMRECAMTQRACTSQAAAAAYGGALQSCHLVPCCST